jgi:hypothetical protein
MVRLDPIPGAFAGLEIVSICKLLILIGFTLRALDLGKNHHKYCTSRIAFHVQDVELWTFGHQPYLPPDTAFQRKVTKIKSPSLHATLEHVKLQLRTR